MPKSRSGTPDVDVCPSFGAADEGESHEGKFKPRDEENAALAGEVEESASERMLMCTARAAMTGEVALLELEEGDSEAPKLEGDASSRADGIAGDASSLGRLSVLAGPDSDVRMRCNGGRFFVELDAPTGIEEGGGWLIYTRPAPKAKAGAMGHSAFRLIPHCDREYPEPCSVGLHGFAMQCVCGGNEKAGQHLQTAGSSSAVGYERHIDLVLFVRVSRL